LQNRKSQRAYGKVKSEKTKGGDEKKGKNEGRN
jgi:hypothetical protein